LFSFSLFFLSQQEIMEGSMRGENFLTILHVTTYGYDFLAMCSYGVLVTSLQFLNYMA
jgi:hypothetical protein